MSSAIRSISRGALSRLSFIRPKAFALDPVILKKQATEKTGLSDFGEDDYEEGLKVLCQSAREDANLHDGGRYVFCRRAVSALATRLHLVTLRNERKEIFQASLPRPLLVIGLPRSGTTLLHRLLSLADDSRALAAWEVLNPIPRPGLDIRKFLTAAGIALMKRSAPDLDAKHRVEATAPEECTFLLDPSFRSPGFWLIFPVFGYLNWLLGQNMQPAYKTYRELLQLLQRSAPEKRFVLKAPAHTGHISELLSVIPELKLVQTHRDPIAVVASVNSMFKSMHGGGSKHFDLNRMARANLDMLATMTEHNFSSRDTIEPDRILDIRYDELTENPIGVLKRVHLHFDLPYTDRYIDGATKWLAKHPQGRYGRHSYGLEEFGIQREEVKERFERYTRTFL